MRPFYLLLTFYAADYCSVRGGQECGAGVGWECSLAPKTFVQFVFFCTHCLSLFGLTVMCGTFGKFQYKEQRAEQSGHSIADTGSFTLQIFVVSRVR